MTPAILLASLVAAAALPASELARAVPQDAVAAVFLYPEHEGNEGNSVSGGGLALAAVLVQQARQSGLASGLGASASIAADVLASLPLLAQYPTAAFLLHVLNSSIHLRLFLRHSPDIED